MKEVSKNTAAESATIGNSAENTDASSQEPQPASKQENRGQIQRGTLREYFVTIVVCTIFALFVTTYVIHPMTVPTPSMVPTIEVGDRLLIDKFTFRNHFNPGPGAAASLPIRRGDIVVFKYPDDLSTLYVKRVVGLPGEHLQIRNKTVLINGRSLEEPYKVHSDPEIFGVVDFHGAQGRDNYGPVAIPEGQFFVMGDNRDDSRDSRYFGLLDRDLIVGRPLMVFWSYEDKPDAYLISGIDLIKLYAERILYFFPRTRWRRIGHLVR